MSVPALPRRPDLAFLLGVVLLVVLSRVLPHPPNFTAAEAVALYLGGRLADRRLAMLLPLVAMALSDVALAALHGFAYGFHGGMLTIYLLLSVNVLIGMRFLRHGSLLRFAGCGLASVGFFWLASNAAVWLGSGMYPLDLGGLLACYVLALPFLGNSLAGMAVFGGLLFVLDRYRATVSAPAAA